MIKWSLDVEGQDYRAAKAYLSILFKEARVAKIIARFRRAPVAKVKVGSPTVSTEQVGSP